MKSIPKTKISVTMNTLKTMILILILIQKQTLKVFLEIAVLANLKIRHNF